MSSKSVNKESINRHLRNFITAAVAIWFMASFFGYDIFEKSYFLLKIFKLYKSDCLLQGYNFFRFLSLSWRFVY